MQKTSFTAAWASTRYLLAGPWLLAALCVAPGSAAAAPSFCPPPGGPAVCPGGQQQVGDLLITLTGGSAPDVLGLHPSTGAYYLFSQVNPLSAGNPQLQDITTEPDNPTQTLIVVNDDGANNGHAGIIEVNSCGNVINPAWGVFLSAPPPPPQIAETLPPPFPPLTQTGIGINNDDINFSAATGQLFSFGDSLSLLTGGSAQLVFTFPSTGGVAAVTPGTGAFADPVTNGAIASDEFGNMYLGAQGSPGTITKYSAGTLATSTPSAVFLLPQPGTSSPITAEIMGMVYAGDNTLFVTAGTDLWKVNTITGATTLWINTLTNPQQLTIDTSGHLWVAEQANTGAVVEINSTGAAGAVIQTFPVPASIGAMFGNAGGSVVPAGIAVYGESLPAIRTVCTLFPTLGDALQATTGPVGVNPPALIDSYKSCNGAYGGSNVSSDGNVQAGRSITVNSGAVIRGSITPNSPVTPTPFPQPAGLVSGGDLNPSRQVTLPAGDYLFRNININSGGSIVGTGGLVRIWYTGTLNIGGPVTSASNLPENLWFFGEQGSGSVNFNAGVTVTGVIYAPTAPSVAMNTRNATLFGALIGGVQATVNAGAIHFDQVLAGTTCP
jgi:hypothetical protein